MKVCEIQITYDNPKNSELSVELPLEDDKFISLQENDLEIQELHDKVKAGMYSDFYLVKNNVLFRSIVDNGHKLKARVIPESLVDVLLHLGHNQSGHNGYHRTYAAIKHLYFWKGMRVQILRYFKSCKVCAVQKVQKTKFEKQIFDPGVQPMEFVSMDLIGEFHPPSSKGNRYALTVVCMLTGYTFCIPLRNKSAEEIVTAWRNHIAFLFGVCRKLLMDNGTKFKNDLFSRVSEQRGFERKIYSPPYRLQSNGGIEGFHKFLKSCLANHISRHRGWDNVVPLARASYNWLPNQHSKESPFFVMFGRDALTNLSQLTKPNNCLNGPNESMDPKTHEFYRKRGNNDRKERIGRSAHFDVVPLLLEAGRQCATAKQERRRHVRPLEEPTLPVHASESVGSGLSQLVGGVHPVPEAQDAATELEMPRINAARPHRRQTKTKPAPGGGGGSPPSSPECPGGADSDDYSTASESGDGHRHRRRRRVARRLALARLNLPIFRSTDANADVTYEIWRFDVQGWLDQYDEMSMCPHIFGSLQGYPGKWACSLPGGMNISLNDLLRRMGRTFGNVRDYDSMIRSLYEICQKENESVEEYMLRVHEAVAVVKHAYPNQVPNEGESLRRDDFYYGLTPSLRDALSFAMADLLEREQEDTSFDTLYHLAKKLEARHQPHNVTKVGSSTHDPHKGYKKYPTLVGHAATVEPDLLPPDPDPVENAPPKPDYIEGLSLRMMQAMNYYQKQEHKCFMCGDSGHFTRDCPHHEAFHAWQKDLNFQGAGQKNKAPAPKTQASN